MKKLVSLLIAAVFLLGMTLPAMAADMDFYGQTRLNTFWVDNSKEVTGMDDSSVELDHELNAVNRVGARVDAGVINGRWEMGITTGGTANYSRLLYGTIDLEEAVGMSGQLLVGRAYMPMDFASLGLSLQSYPADNNLLGYLGYMDRQEGLQYSIDGFKFALVKPNEPSDLQGEVQLPQFQASYDLNLTEGLAFNFAGVYQTYDLNEGNDPGGGDSLTSWNSYADVRLSMMDPLYVNLGGFYGQNVGTLGACRVKGAPVTTGAGSSVDEDTTTYSGVGVIGANLAGGIRVETGAGYQESENDDWAKDDEQATYYVQAQIPITDNGNAFIMPEIGYTDLMDDEAGNDQGDQTWYGMQTRVVF